MSEVVEKAVEALNAKMDGCRWWHG